MFTAAAFALAVCLAWLAWDGWSYLHRGYSIGVAGAGGPPLVFHVDFPLSRAAVHVLLWGAAMGTIVGYGAARNWAPVAGWMTLAASCGVGIHDIAEYGAMGSPTSVWTLLLLLILAVLAQWLPLGAGSDA